MDLVVCPQAEDVALLAARRIAERLRATPSLVLGLATGRSMEPIYAELVRMHRQEGLCFAQCRSFNLDEYAGLGPDHPNAYRRYMNDHLFAQVDIAMANTQLPDGLAPDMAAEGQRYEALIREAGGIDLQLLGIGENGHVGFNEPMSAVDSRTRGIGLTPETRHQNAGMFGGDLGRMPTRAITMGIATILEARELLLVATGAAKAAALAEAIDGPVSLRHPGSALRGHPRFGVIADTDAASHLPAR